MPLQLDSQRVVTLVVGASGTGKTSFTIRYILNRENVSQRFFFDWRGEYALRLNLPAASTANGLDRQLQTGWVIFDPTRCFPGRSPDAFRFYCEWIASLAGEIEGRKILVVDEVQRFCSPQSIPPEFTHLIEAGRSLGVELFVNAQRPNALSEVLTGQLTEVVAFQTPAPNALEWLERNAQMDPDRVRRLARLNFMARDIERGGELSGIVKI